MNQKLMIGAALAVALSGAVVSPAAYAGGKEKCYGISPVGGNDCGNIAGTHSCAGQSKVANDPGEWKLVAKGTCGSLGGFDKATAKKIVAQQG
ncbi:DUF2282 domain-containing protein [Spongiibacter marinus]|uniref:DUF2282 domain-containing protein n=1 Tax=Spongiibacter marinus TaxID=354246 RepID=UPI0035BE3894